MNHLNKIKISLYWVIMALLLQACSKNAESVYPGGKRDAMVNFYYTSDVFAKVLQPNDYQPFFAPIFLDSVFRPQFNWTVPNGLEYPKSYSQNEPVTYSRLTDRQHRFMFSDTTLNLSDSTLNIIADTTLTLQAGSRTNFYLADRPADAASVPAYKILITNEDYTVPDDKVAVRFIHLSPDAGSVDIGLVKSDGTASNVVKLAFGTHTDVQYYSRADITSNGVIGFLIENKEEEVAFSTGVAFTPKRSYAIILRGFRQDAQRKNPGRQEDTYYIPAALRLNTRIIK